MEKPLILDFGTVSFRVGRAGDKNPTFFVPPVIGKPLMKDSKGDLCDFTGGSGQNPLEYTIFPLNPRDKHDNVIPISAITYGENGFEVNQSLLERLLDGCLGVKGMDESLQDTPVIVSEPSLHNPKFRQNFTELLFETFKVENVFLCKRSALSCYASACTSGVVVDIGGSCTNIAPVLEGYTLQDHVKEEPTGGTLIDRIFYSYLSSIGITVRPSYEYSKPPKSESNTNGVNNGVEVDTTVVKGVVGKKPVKRDDSKVLIRKLPFVHEDYYHWSALYATSVLKETCIVLNEEINVNSSGREAYCYALPDGNYLDVENSKRLCGIFCSSIFSKTEYLHNKHSVKSSNQDSIDMESVYSRKGLSTLLTDCYGELLDSEVNRVVLDQLVVSGGCTRHPAVVPILERDVEEYLRKKKLESGPRLVAVGGNEQQFSSYIGASILSSLGAFTSFCVNLADVQELGLQRALQRRCP
ncbi:actin, putative [Theileria annulata]|uniref:Actin, putative n=1 Tax=Theileria annulata TaxID=5874 RepID=Q4UIK3_THEAN|nr:actin, putative [Theileria annulata]CAI73086.1 actin, putative [Theileria annulata]|eukprot:XP_953764.1 actin, putative [Theileria annulata]